MTYTDLLTRGRALSEDERTIGLRKLLGREEAPALLAWLEDYFKAGFVDSLGDQKLAGHHGCLEHCAGSIHAVKKLQDELSQLLVPPARQRPRPD